MATSDMRPGRLNYLRAIGATKATPPAWRSPAPAGTLATPELLEVLGHAIKPRPIEYLATELQEIDSVNITGGGAKGVTRCWAQPAVHRMQVAVALAQVVGAHTKHSVLPSVARAAFECETDPPAPCWAIWKQQAVSYVLYNADVGQAVRPDGGVVAPIDTLWTPTEGP